MRTYPFTMLATGILALNVNAATMSISSSAPSSSLTFQNDNGIQSFDKTLNVKNDVPGGQTFQVPGTSVFDIDAFTFQIWGSKKLTTGDDLTFTFYKDFTVATFDPTVATSLVALTYELTATDISNLIKGNYMSISLGSGDGADLDGLSGNTDYAVVLSAVFADVLGELSIASANDTSYTTGLAYGGSPSTRIPGSDADFYIQGTLVPEPATLAMLGLGACALLFRRKCQ